MVIESVRRFPGAISFIAQGAVADQGGIKKLSINGLFPDDEGYPYSQTFSFITKGKPKGAAKVFIDFAFSDKGRAIAKKRGLCPMPCPIP